MLQAAGEVNADVPLEDPLVVRFLALLHNLVMDCGSDAGLACPCPTAFAGDNPGAAAVESVEAVEHCSSAAGVEATAAMVPAEAVETAIEAPPSKPGRGSGCDAEAAKAWGCPESDSAAMALAAAAPLNFVD